jgi:hypothetical protein
MPAAAQNKPINAYVEFMRDHVSSPYEIWLLYHGITYAYQCQVFKNLITGLAFGALAGVIASRSSKL